MLASYLTVFDRSFSECWLGGCRHPSGCKKEQETEKVSEHSKKYWLPLGASIVCIFTASCSQRADMSSIDAEAMKPVHRYDISQAVASNTKVVVAGTQSGAVLVSSDMGASWKREQLGQASLVDIATCGEKGFVAIDHYRKVWFSGADGTDWKSVKIESPRTPIAVTCDKKGGWWVAGVNSVIAGSSDQGMTWQVTDFKEDTQITAINFFDDGHGIAIGEFGLTAFTEDGGVTWKKGAKIPSDFYPYSSVFRDAREGWVSGIAGQMLHTTDGGKSWTKQINTTQATLNRLFMHEGQPFGVGAGGVIARLEGDSWRAVPYTDPVPVFLGGGASLPGQSAVVIGGPGGLLRAVSTHAKQ